MQVSATLIAAQQAARDARARLQVPQPEAKANFAAALEKTPGTGFSPLPLKQIAPAVPQAMAQAQPQASGRMGMHIDITV